MSDILWLGKRNDSLRHAVKPIIQRNISPSYHISHALQKLSLQSYDLAIVDSFIHGTEQVMPESQYSPSDWVENDCRAIALMREMDGEMPIVLTYDLKYHGQFPQGNPKTPFERYMAAGVTEVIDMQTVRHVNTLADIIRRNLRKVPA